MYILVVLPFLRAHVSRSAVTDLYYVHQFVWPRPVVCPSIVVISGVDSGSCELISARVCAIEGETRGPHAGFVKPDCRY